MKVSSVAIDGFKSYAHRQELADLDHHFNAITGLNGSGKSNVFDAICFVMGLRNIQKARVERLEELIYKNGKAGIQRAAVTITFDNSDPSQAPTGFPSNEYPVITVSRQIDTGLRQRFFLNGRSCDADKIKEFFLHASLNIENPHFLVQQGQIHRLIGMKPQDILGFIEEAAGTSVFDHSRRKAELQMRSKEKRLAEINESIEKEIAPALENIEKQESDHAKLLDAEGKIERLRHFLLAFHLFKTEAIARASKNRLESVLGKISDLQLQKRETEQSIAEKEIEAAKLEEEMKGPTHRSQELTDEVGKLKTSLARCRGNLTGARKDASAADSELAKNDAELTKAQEKYDKFNNNSDNTLGRHEEIKTELDETNNEIDNLVQSLRLQKNGVQAGLRGMSLPEEKSALDRSLVELQGKVGRAKQRVDALDRELAGQRRDQENMSAQQTQRERELKTALQNLKGAEDAFRPFEAGRTKLANLSTTLSQFSQRQQTAKESLQRDYNFCAPLQYKEGLLYRGQPIEPQVLGRVGEFIQVSDESHSFALSVGAGASLQRFIVTNDEVAAIFCVKDNMPQRQVFMPLEETNNMNNNNRNYQPAVDPNRVQHAKQIASQFEDGWAALASDLITYDRERYGKIIEKVFNFVVCSSNQVAQAIAFNPNCRIKAVSIDGDVVEAHGVMTGGARGNLNDFIQLFARARPLLESYRSAIADARQLRQESALLQQNTEKARNLEQSVNRFRDEVSRLEHALKHSRFAEVENQIQQLAKERADAANFCENEAPKMKQAVETRLAEIARAETLDTATLVKEIEQKIQKAKQKVQALQNELQKGNDAHDKQEREKNALRGKLESLQTTVDENKTDLAEKRAEEAKIVEETQQLEENLKNRSTLLVEAKHRLDSLQQQYAQVAKDLDNLGSEKSSLEDNLQLSQTERSEAERNAKTAADELRKHENSSAINAFMTPAIRRTLGDPNGDYYFSDEDRTNATLLELDECERLIVNLNKAVNRTQLATLDQRKAENRKLVEQRDALMDDKSNITHSITEVEKRKWGALDDVVAQVSQHFSALFNTCLDYATCRLSEQRDPETNRLLGLEVKVAFNGKEKAGLTELSGGQRSLLALCLILSILKVHRAPIYILDEVDAALDPSHTQNLGLMLKKHFADAQFLLVSLKDGMFSSANVIYEVRNTQGFSEVTRKQMKRK